MKINFQEGQLLLMYKPLAWTSFDLVKKVKYMIRKKFNLRKIKVGHGGTLDPMAEGLMLIATGRFTKKLNELHTLNKEYIATIKLGFTSPSFDIETELCSTNSNIEITESKLNETIKEFLGEQLQFPPVFSAKNVNGKRAYESARQGKEIEIKANKVVIHDIQILKYAYPFARIKVNCSKGTYIRSLANDIGVKLGCGAVLIGLKRTKIGEYELKKSLNISDFQHLLDSL